MKQFLPGALDCLITVVALKVLGLHILLFGDEDDRHLINPVGIGNAVELAEVNRLLEIGKDIFDGG